MRQTAEIEPFDPHGFLYSNRTHYDDETRFPNRLSSPNYRFAEVEFDPANLSLRVSGELRAVEPKTYRLLAFLVENRGRVVPKDEILRIVWEDTAVTDNALTRAIAQLRKALDDDAREPRFIETVPTVGYRFIGPIETATPPLTKAPAAAVPVRNHAARNAIVLGAVAFLVALAVFAFFGLRGRAPEPPPMPRPVPLTTYRGTEDMPSFSPDGNQVAFVWDGENEDNDDIYVKVLGSDSTPLRLTTNPARDIWPDWSPDGRTIAFVRVTSADRCALMLIPALGGPERKLGEFPFRTPARGANPAWSANSRWIALPVSEGGRTVLYRVSVDSGEAVRLTEPETTTNESWPKLSPDGRTLIFTRRPDYSPGHVYRMAVDENLKPLDKPRLLPTGQTLIGGTAWTADGREIMGSTPSGIVRFPAEAGAEPQLVPWLNSSVDWMDISHTGNRMVYSQIRGDANVWRIDLTAKVLAPERLLASTFRDAFPQYSPDGQHIAFYSNRSGTLQTWISDARGEQARQLTFVKNGATGTPGWSPDGKTLVLDSNQSGDYQVYTMSAEGGAMKQLTSGTRANYSATWSRDGRWIYFASNRSGRSEIWKMPSNGGAAVQVTHNNGVRAIESLDGTTLYIAKDSGEGSIWKMPVAGGPETQLASSLFRFNFAVTRAGIYFMTQPTDTGKSLLKFYSFASGSAATVFTMGFPAFGLDVSPDGRWLAYAELDDVAADLMLAENFH
jgi:Tol biopolymer transport system component/DNA-binding winged helix-turn-helix (wHTH) protein